MRYRLGVMALVLAVVHLAGASEAQQLLPPPPPPSSLQPGGGTARLGGSATLRFDTGGNALYQADFFADTRWSDAVREEVRTEERRTDGMLQRPPQLENTRGEAGGSSQGFQRGSIDQAVLQQIIMDRTRRVAMNAVADAISEIAGPVGDRQYIRQLLNDVAALLTDRTGMQNTLVEQLVATLARAVIADAVVRLRLPGRAVVDPCAWRRAIYGEDADLDAAACASFPIKLVEGRPALTTCAPGAASRPVACSFLTSTDPPRPWLPTQVGPSDSIRMRAYLVDLAFWSLGRTEIFARQAPVPSCPFDENSALRSLCRYVEGTSRPSHPAPPPPTGRGSAAASASAAAISGAAASGGAAAEALSEEQAVARQNQQDSIAARAAWLSGTAGLVGAIQVAHDLMTLLRPPLNSRLRTLINTVLANPELGVLGKLGLDPAAWEELAGYTEWVEAWRDVTAMRVALDAYLSAPVAPHAHTPAYDTLRRTMENVRRRLGRYVWPPAEGPAPTAGASAVMAGFVVEGGFNATGAAATAEACRDTPTGVSGWVRVMLTTDRLERAADLAAGDARRAALCVPVALQAMSDAVARTGATDAQVDAALGRLARAATSVRTAVDTMRRVLPDLTRASAYGNPGLEIASIALDRVADIVRAMQMLGTALEDLRAVAEGELVASLVHSLPDAPDLHERFLGIRRAVSGVSRMLRIAAALDIEALRDRGIATAGSAFGALRTLGGPVLARLGPILAIIPLDRQITVETMLVMLEHINPEDIVVALGVAPARGRWCDENERGLACWLQRIVAVLREVTDVQDARVSVDSDRLVRTLGALGDDFRRRREWRAYFHLTIGIGEMVSLRPTPGATSPLAFDLGFVPVMAEQIGIGVASPSFARDRLNFRAGLFASGLLYRLVLNSTESEAFFFGGFLALDLYELLEVFVAPTALVYPPGTPNAPPVSFGVIAGASVPLGDYLSRL